MPDFMISVDGRDVEVAGERVDVRAVLTTLGADPSRRDVLVRTDGGAARFVLPGDPIEPSSGKPRFRLHRGASLRHLKVDGRTWDWGAPNISAEDIREIAGLPEDQQLVVANMGGELLRAGALLDLTTDWVPHVVTRASRDVGPVHATVPVVVNGRTRELVAQEVTFEDLIGLAFPERTDLANRLFTVTFRHGPADRPEGSLVATQSIQCKSGTVFHVTATDKS